MTVTMNLQIKLNVEDSWKIKNMNHTSPRSEQANCMTIDAGMEPLKADKLKRT